MNSHVQESSPQGPTPTESLQRAGSTFSSTGGYTSAQSSDHVKQQPNGDTSNSASTVEEEAPKPVETKVLIIGAGPAGASLACFLASYGIKGLMISNAPGTANTPRAHITNMAALECLRDIGLDKEMTRVASDGDCMVHTRWCHSMAGEEYARIHSWGNGPKRKGDYELASPCAPIDLPQTDLEPILVRHAIQHGFNTRFDTTLLCFEEAGDMIKATVLDNISGQKFQIHTKYLFGADGARSKVVRHLDLPLCAKPGQGVAINVLVKTDLSHLVKHRRGNLHWVMQPDREHPAFGWQGIVRMVKPWNEWMFILLPTQDFDKHTQPSENEYRKRVQEFIGDDTPAEILNISKWFINEIVAEEYSRGNIFCLGDAVHRHPPMNGLGSNTCIQDAFNLAWKIAYVEQGLAPQSLLSTYSVERQSVGQSIVTRANDGFRDHYKIWESMGTVLEDVASRRKIMEQLQAPSPEGQKRRLAFQDAIEQTTHEFNGLGIEMGQLYNGSGIYTADEPRPYERSGRAKANDTLYYEPSTYPGCRLPHVWLNKAMPTEPKSTIDLVGHGAFTLLTGIGGHDWKSAADKASSQLGVTIGVHSIGFRQDWEDVYFDWASRRGVEESGAVLVRPDRFVAWRAPVVLGSEETCGVKLLQVMRSVLGHDAQPWSAVKPERLLSMAVIETLGKSPEPGEVSGTWGSLRNHGTVHRRKRQKKDRSGGEYRSDTDASPAQQTNRNDFDFTEPPALLASANSPCTCFSFERPSCTGQSERVSSPATTSPKRRFAQDESAVTQEAPLAVHDISFIMHPSHEGLSPGRDSIMSTSNGSPGQKPLHIAESCSSLGVDQSTLKEGIKLFFDNMVAINILHEPTFWERLNGIGSAPQLHALLAAMLAFAARFYPTAVGCYTRADIGNQEVSPLQPAHLLDLAFSKVDEALKECDDDAPPLCILQALILATHCQLTHGVRGKAWRSLGMCIRLGYELNLHLVDADRLVNYPQGTDSRLWTEDEEKRRAWWAIWEMDVFGSTIRRTRPAMDWTQMETFLPVEDQDWFDEQPRPSCFMDLSPLHRWKSLQACGNESPKAWFLVINSLMKEAQVISSPRSTPRKPSPGDWQQARDNDRNQSSGKRGEFAEESSSKLELLANSMHCFTLSLPKHLQYHNQYLSFDSRGLGELISPRQLHCGIHNIYVMTQLARLMIYRYGVFGAQRSHVQGFGTYLRADSTTTGSSTTTKLTPNEKLGSRAAATPYDVENLALPMYFEATDNILSIISRSSQNHIKHINPFLASTVWLASAVQLFRMHLTQGELSRTLIKSKFEALYMTYKRCVSFWDVQTALQQNLQALEAQLTGSETSIRPNNFSPINTEVPGPRASSCQRTNEGQVGSGSYAYDGQQTLLSMNVLSVCNADQLCFC
ncbi:2,4-dichlorophenol 6-monooxygenase [Seiridium cupressi]